MSKADSLKLVALAVASGYLCVSVAWRHRSDLGKWVREWPRRREDRRRCRAFLRRSPHRGFDASAISPRLEQLRHAHVAAAHARCHHTHSLRGFLVAARGAVTRLAYFRDADAKASEPAEHELKPEP
jgi:hypothetical protein